MSASTHSKEAHKRYADWLNWDRRRLSLAIETIPRQSTNHFWNEYSAQANPELVDEDAIDMMTLWDDGDSATPLPYKCLCEPGTLLTPHGDAAMMQSYTLPNIGSEFMVTRCDPSNDRAMLAELRTALRGSGLSPNMLSRRQRMLAYIQGMMIKQERKTLETEIRQWNQAFMLGKARMSGPTIKESDEIINYNRDKRLTGYLPSGKGIDNTKTDPCDFITAVMQMIYELSNTQARTTSVYWSPELWNCVRQSDKWKKYECFCDGLGSGPISRRFSMDLTAPNPAPRGVREVSLRTGDFGERHYVMDEQQTHCRIVDGKVEYYKAPVLPAGSVFFVAGQDHQPMSFYGGIEYMGELSQDGQFGSDSIFREAARRFPNRWADPNGKSWHFELETRPLHTLKRPNATALMFPAIDKCPIPKNLECEAVEFSCSTNLKAA